MAQNLKQLIEEGLVFPALLAEKNDFTLNDYGKGELLKYKKNDKMEKLLNLSKDEKIKFLNLKSLEKLAGYTVPLISHDYGAKTPLMWNTLYEQNGINIRNIMVVGNPEKTEEILNALKKDPKYMGGGAGVGFKESIMPHLDQISPKDLGSVNIISKENGLLIGRNTDAEGFAKGLEEKMKEAGKELLGSNIILLGAGGVAKELARVLATKKIKRITILNRSYEKAVTIAEELNKIHKRIAVGAGEEVIRGYVLNSFIPPDAIINTTDKGSDGPLEKYSALHSATLPATTETIGNNVTISRTIARELKTIYPKTVIADIVLPSSGRSTTLRIADNEGLKYLLDGKPMVIYQAVPAYKMIELAHPEIHKTLDERIILETFKEAAN